MRVTMYTQDYEPLFVLEAHERDLDQLRSRRSVEPFRIGIAMPAPLTAPWERRVDRSLQVQEPARRSYDIRLVVEGMRWADGRTRAILVAHGLLRENLVEGTRMDNLAAEIFHGALRYEEYQQARDRSSVFSNTRNFQVGGWRRVDVSAPANGAPGAGEALTASGVLRAMEAAQSAAGAVMDHVQSAIEPHQIQWLEAAETNRHRRR